VLITFHAVRWVVDATISGQIWWNQATGRVLARLTVRPRRGEPDILTARWLAFAAANQPVMITGTHGGRRIVASAPAP